MAKLNITINDKILEALEKVSESTGLRKSQLIERTIVEALENVELAYQCDQVIANSDPNERVSLEEMKIELGI